MSNEQTTTIRVTNEELDIIRSALSSLRTTRWDEYDKAEHPSETMKAIRHRRWLDTVEVAEKVIKAQESLMIRADEDNIAKWIASGETTYHLRFGNFYSVEFAHFGNSVAAEVLGYVWEDGESKQRVLKRFVDSDGEKIAKAVIKFAKSN